jgi:hypothetical protein
MSLHRIKFKLLNYDAWEEDADFARTKNAWIQAAQCLSTLRYTTPHGLVDVHVNWASSIDGLSSLYRTEAEPQATIEVHTKMNKEAAKNLARSYLELFLNDFFMVFNLAVPGACNFYNTEIISSKPYYRTRINLDSYVIELAIKYSKALGWPIIKDIDMGLVCNWLQALKIETNQVAQSRIERVLFAFLHAIHGDVGIANIIWLSNALESFYDTPSMEIVKHLRNRAFKWLSLPENNKKAVKKEFDKFYNIRSAYVHGTLEILHPLNNEVIDKAVNTQMGKIYDAHQFGLAVLIASIQSLIEKNYHELLFDEVIQGKSI